MTQNLKLKLFSLLFGIVTLLAISACAVAGTAPDPDATTSEPTVIPTPTESAQSADSEPSSTPESSTENTGTTAPQTSSDDDDDARSESEPATDQQTDDAGTSEDASEDETFNPAEPVRIYIDRIGVDAGFEYVGVTSEGNMDVPKGWDNVAWYKPGTVPGDEGNSVIAGHYDAPGNQPAVFYHLNQLVPGDQIRILTADNEELVFEVTEVEIVDEAEAPLKRIFGKTDERNLNLITCEGVWDRSADMYDQRLIVYSTLVSD